MEVLRQLQEGDARKWARKRTSNSHKEELQHLMGGLEESWNGGAQLVASAANRD